MKPRLRVSLGAELPVNYARAVDACGGQADAAYLPPPSAEGYDGLILSGGGDVDPALYGGAAEQCHFVDKRRDQAELALIRVFAEAGKPILGICRGHQLLNVCFGGSLTPHLPTASRHQAAGPGRDRAHTSRALAGSFLAALYGEDFSVNSAHHQGLDRLAPALEAVQWAEDGVVEGCRHRERPIWSVQWHPERLCRTYWNLRQAQEPDFTPLAAVKGEALFCWFVEVAAKYREGML